MLKPIKTQTEPNCINNMNKILHDDYDNSDSNAEAIMELTKSSFLNSVDYRKVYKNFNYNKSYDTWIYEGNSEDKIVGYKFLQSYPYDMPQFKIGDYIHWNYNHTENSTWILTSLDTQYLYNVKGRILQCNNSLRWIDDNGELNCYPCVIKDALTYTNFKWGSKGVIEPSGDIVVIVQKNDFTKKININDRFLFDEVSFKVKARLDEVNPDFMELYMMKTPELSKDNKEDNIAINKPSIEKPDLNGIVISPNITKINKGKKIEFNVYNYVKGVKQENGFKVAVSDVPKEYFNLEIISPNKFYITNLNAYQINPIKVECTDVISGEMANKKIWLGGNW